MDPQTIDPQSLNLKDIHLPEAISWWPPAPGWWLLAAALLLTLAASLIARKIYLGRQLRRDIASELETIRQQYQQTQNKSQLVKSLSILIRRASITFYPSKNIAGLTGEDWLVLLDRTNANSSAAVKFDSDTGKILLTAPYQPEDTIADFDAQGLICLCESWLLSPHKDKLPVTTS